MRAVWWPVVSIDAPAMALVHRGVARKAEHRRRGAWRHVARSTAMAACCALGGLACGAANEAPVAYALQLEAIEGHGDLSVRGIRAELDRAVRGSTMFAHRDTQRASTPLAARLRIAILRTSDERDVLRIELTVDEPPEPVRSALGRDFEAIVELERVDGSLELEEDLPEGLRRAVAVLETKAVLVQGDGAALERILAHPDPELVVLGVEWIGRHRLREHADAVAALVGHPDDRVALRAVECLGIVGTQAHARVLVARPRLADRAHASRLYETLAGLGGPDAVGFLEFAARNEDDPTRAAIAKRALEHARFREARDAAPPGRPLPMRGHR